jgi:hypothetical protein
VGRRSRGGNAVGLRGEGGHSSLSKRSLGFSNNIDKHRWQEKVGEWLATGGWGELSGQHLLWRNVFLLLIFILRNESSGRWGFGYLSSTPSSGA